MDFFRQIISLVSEGGEFASFVLGMTLSATRILAILRMLPPLGGRIVPASLQIVLSLVLAFILGGQVSIDGMPSMPLVVLLILKEAAVGFIIGFIASLPFYFMEQAGYLMDISRGGAMSQLFSPTGENVATPLSNMFFYLCILGFFATPAGASFWMALETTFRTVPLYPAAELLPQHGRMLGLCIATVAKLFLSSIMFAFPVMLLVLIVDILMGILGRFSPYSGSYFVSLPLRSAAGICGAALALVFVSPIVEGMLTDAIDSINHLFGI